MPHRVVQWGTGNVGFHSLRHLIRHPGYELVGVHAHSEAKQGKDAARLCGLDENTGPAVAAHEVAERIRRLTVVRAYLDESDVAAAPPKSLQAIPRTT